MNAGELRHQISIQKPSSTSRNSYGEEVITWSTDSKPWAAIIPMRGREYFDAGRVQSDISHRIRIRNQTLSATTAIGPVCRIRFGTRYFEIKSVIRPDERNIMLDLMCRESS